MSEGGRKRDRGMSEGGRKRDRGMRERVREMVESGSEEEKKWKGEKG